MDNYFKKEISYNFGGKKFTFSVAENLFSSFDIDRGTDLLIKNIKLENPKTILDLGCGYGVLGIILAKLNPHANAFLVDRDLLAVRYTNFNIVKNNLSNATAIESIGVEAVKNKTFDLIVSNIPAKIGDEAIINEFLLKPYSLLNQNGEFWIVAVSGLNRLIPKVARDNKLKIQMIKKRGGHTVYRLYRCDF